MKANLKSVLNILVFVCIAAFFLWFAYRKTDFNEIKTILANGVNYRWVIISALLTLLSNFPRTWRWQLLLEPVEKKSGFWNTFFAVNLGYFANLALPRMGELTRCGVLSRYEKINFTKTVGTVVTERVIDMLTMGVLCLLTFFLELSVFRLFFSKYAIHWDSNPILLSILVGLLILGLVVLYLIHRYFWNHHWVLKIRHVIHSLWQGMKSIRRVRHKKMFIFHSILVWACYYLGLFACMFAFNFLDHITASQALFVFIAGTLSMVLPAPGGMGPWHTFTIQALILYGIDNTQAGAFALVANGASMLTIIVMGIISMIALPIYNKGKI